MCAQLENEIFMVEEVNYQFSSSFGEEVLQSRESRGQGRAGGCSSVTCQCCEAAAFSLGDASTGLLLPQSALRATEV